MAFEGIFGKKKEPDPIVIKKQTPQEQKFAAMDAAGKKAAEDYRKSATEPYRAKAAEVEYETASRYGGEGTFKYRREKPKA